jgi:DNA-binding transcriptional ArsR family regulator
VAEITEPALETVELAAVLAALADEHRLNIVAELAGSGEMRCGSVDLELSKATRSHHFRVLREAGITATRQEGSHRWVSLRSDELETRFPGLLDAILSDRRSLA